MHEERIYKVKYGFRLNRDHDIFRYFIRLKLILLVIYIYAAQAIPLLMPAEVFFCLLFQYRR